VSPASKPRRELVPLLMLGSDGNVYACCPAKDMPTGLLEHPETIVAVRLSERERDVALDALQIGVIEAAEALKAKPFDA
jgi:hypothetical protein